MSVKLSLSDRIYQIYYEPTKFAEQYLDHLYDADYRRYYHVLQFYDLSMRDLDFNYITTLTENLRIVTNLSTTALLAVIARYVLEVDQRRRDRDVEARIKEQEKKKTS